MPSPLPPRPYTAAKTRAYRYSQLQMPVWSRDGRYLAFVETVGSSRWLAWSPDGGQLAFVSNRGADLAQHPALADQLWIAQADGSQANALGPLLLEPIVP